MLFQVCFVIYLSAMAIAFPLDVSSLEEPPEESSPSSILEGLTFLNKYKYLEIGPNKNGKLPSDEAITSALRQMQRFAGIEETGTFDAPTIEMMRTPRCGLPDVVVRESTSRVRRYNLAGVERYRWFTNHLTYRIDNYPTNSMSNTNTALTNDEVDAIISDALKVWSDVSPLEFQRTDSDADIVILFGARSHTSVQFDPVFDGPGGTLGHAFTPNSGWGETNGDVHMDDDETFTHEVYTGTDLFYTIAHELGHALGLDHSSNVEALMWPYDRGYVPNFKLPADDTAGIQAIYGSKPTPIPPPAVYCNTTFNAIAVINQRLYVFSETLLWQFTLDGDLLTNPAGENPRQHFKKLPRRIQAVYERWYDGKVVFLKGEKFYVYDGGVAETPKKGLEIRKNLSPSLPKSITAALHDQHNGTTDFIRGKKVWRFNEIRGGVVEGFPKRLGSEIFPGAPTKPTGAFFDKFGDAIILNGRDYYKYSKTADGNYRLAAGIYPHDFANDFLHCQAPSAITGQ